MRQVVIAGNWKMNKTLPEVKQFIKELKESNVANVSAEVMIFAPSVYLSELVKLTEGTNITIGAQNIHQAESGAFTGEISVSMIKSIGVNTTLIGHSERREYYNETDAIVNQKLQLALANDVKPVLCIGEVLAERESNLTNSILKEQLEKAFVDVSIEDVAKVIVAYEPVWAIGTGKTATAEDANSACAFVRQTIAKLYSEEIAEQMVIQYGGSVSPANVQELLSQSDIDGALVGGASLEVESYLQLIK